MSRQFIASLVVVLAACLDVAAGSTCTVQTPAVAPLGAGAVMPSRLDYLALASMADAQRPLAMAGYRPSKGAVPLP